MPSPTSSMPALLEMTVKFLTWESRNAISRFSGMPQSPKPPDMIVMPSCSNPCNALVASLNIFFEDAATEVVIDTPLMNDRCRAIIQGKHHQCTRWTQE